jgi:hypothetical protein
MISYFTIFGFELPDGWNPKVREFLGQISPFSIETGAAP